MSAGKQGRISSPAWALKQIQCFTSYSACFNTLQLPSIFIQYLTLNTIWTQLLEGFEDRHVEIQTNSRGHTNTSRWKPVAHQSPPSSWGEGSMGLPVISKDLTFLELAPKVSSQMWSTTLVKPWHDGYSTPEATLQCFHLCSPKEWCCTFLVYSCRTPNLQIWD